MDGGISITTLPALATAAPTEKPKRYFWTNREIALIEEHFPAGGVNACLPLLPNRTASSIYQQANKMGLRAPKQPAKRQSWTSNEHIDSAIRRVYQSENIDKGAVHALADQIGRPRWWVKKRAQALGCVAPRFREPAWTDDEVEVLEDNATKHPDSIRRILARRGFKRTTTAIIVKMKRLGVERTDMDHFTARGLADVMGVDSKVVTRWIEKCGLKAGRRGTDRVDAQGGDQWWIHRKDFRRFVVENAALIDLRKVVDKEWFIDLLANGG